VSISSTKLKVEGGDYGVAEKKVVGLFTEEGGGLFTEEVDLT